MAVPILAGFDLNVRLEEEEDINLPFQVNEPILEDHNNYGNVCFMSFFYVHSHNIKLDFFSQLFLSFFDRL
jgi:hypothetical protein